MSTRPLETIKSRKDFDAARRSPSASTASFKLVKRRRDDLLPTRVGFTITKKIGGAVIRNRIRRRLKAACRERLTGKSKPGADFIFIARKAALHRPYELLLDDLDRALLSLGD
ncbi:MAG: ribonuclease P protein component [Pseudomonadota bacterium]